MKVSVIIPTHNSERTLERAILSVRNQTAKCDIEILLCDDHSRDKAFLADIATKYGCTLLHVHGRGGGPNYGRNLGLKYATGDVVAFLDHDDEWMPWKLAEQLKHIENGAEFVYSQSITVKE